MGNLSRLTWQDKYYNGEFTAYDGFCEATQRIVSTSRHTEAGWGIASHSGAGYIEDCSDDWYMNVRHLKK
ncbi:hypothetical protein K0T92_04880 [Paenibacillus oenotherae]|uniref:Uncharacterized protein n=1 Tax=Paenibacillus oenotherae TaxID=1435645 RepID=A0ABS7D2C2_9BACL|nr:hypothetical protein [Paenibacillus oenotherae]MBW7474067.1 hypothetical protein [Paenibacillus oenotherae]